MERKIEIPEIPDEIRAEIDADPVRREILASAIKRPPTSSIK